MLLELLIFLIFPVLVNVFLVKVVLPGRDEGSNDLLIPEVLPREILEPWVLLDLRWSVFPESIYWLSLYHLHKSLTANIFIPC